MSRSRRRTGSSTKKQSADRAATRTFWGEALTEDPPPVRMSEDPAAMVLSLGEPPLRGNDRAAQATFTLVYRKAAQLATGVATAAGLDDDLSD